MRIYFSPTFPDQWDYSIIAMIHYLGYSVARTPHEPFDFGYMWQDCTRLEPPAELLEIARERLVLNIGCSDISKRRVDEVAERACGYGSLVDPRTFEGKCIRKHDDNGTRAGEILDCPVDVQDWDRSFVYQRFIETGPGGPQREYRVPIVMGSVPIVFEVFKDAPESLPERKLRQQLLHSITPREVAQVFNAAEQEQLLRFCSDLGFDIGELDVLRCAESGRMYILDANTTPTYFSMYNRYWKPAEKRKAIAAVSECWEERLLARIPAGPR